MRMELVSTNSHDYPGYEDCEKDRVDAALKGCIKIDNYTYARAGYGEHSWVLKMFVYFPDEE